MADPNLEVRPDFAAAPYQVVQEALVNAIVENDEQAIAHLADAWDADHDQRIADWNAAREAQNQEGRPGQPQQPPNAPNALENVNNDEAGTDVVDSEKKKPKISDFNAERPPPSVIIPRPPQYAIQKISTFEYIELWYFSTEGCNEASHNQRSHADDTFGITAVHDLLTLRPVASVKASHNACADCDLSFSQFLQAKNNFLHHIKQVSWPDKHVDALAEFFWNLDNHPMRLNENGETIILLYASRVR
ncbi:hypothetical protein EV363DRAFT_1445946 [Boletus edulis]|nr:hypothetical protein EV363DRAFT_1445946 [Boletus edulis]